MKFLPAIMCFFFLISCNDGKKELSADQIIERTIENAGGDRYDNANIHFTFREGTYGSKRKNGMYELTRKTSDSLGEIEDVLSNSNFERFVNGNELQLADSTKTKYSNSVNSVHYFAQLPYGLQSEAVNKKLLGTSEIKGKEYYKIKVTFEEEGGGEDHDDIYMYWINKKDFTIDYFAYKFYTGEGGIRFREAYNPRTIEGIRFVDYKNYKIEPWRDIDLKDLDKLFEDGKMDFLSDIKTENIEVENT